MFAIADEVAGALAAGGPVVALESSIIAHGLPYPANLETALAAEQAVRDGGAVPATIAIVSGIAHVGLSRADLEHLAAPGADHAKAGSADIAPLLVRGASAGTTVSGTCQLASRARIRVFATGGIGGVHRGDDGDVSSDLRALATTSIAVVSAGPKSILDLPRTMEALETLGVLTVGVGTSELPAFYSRASGIALEHRVDSVDELAALIAVRFDGLGQGGVLVANPVDEADEIAAAELAPVLAAAEARAARDGVRGKALTPFLLAEVRAELGDRALRCNAALVVANATLAARLACALGEPQPDS